MDNLLFPETGWGNTESVLEKNAEGNHAFEPDGLAYFADGQASTRQQFLCLPQFAIDEVLVRRDIIHLLEHPEKMLAVHGGLGANVLQGDLLIIMGIHPVAGS